MLRECAREEHADTVLWRLLHECRFLAVFGAMEGGEQRRENLLAFYGYARDLSAGGKGSLFDFITHLRRLLETGETPPLAGRRSAGGVRIMSIDKSKGLEFPIVFLCDLSKRFNTMDLRSPVLVHPQLGLGCERVDRQRRIRYDTISKTALSMKLQREDKAEEMRILYVALTRPQEKLIAVDCRRKMDSVMEKLSLSAQLPVAPEVVENATCLGDWLLMPLLCDITGGGWQVKKWRNPTAAVKRGAEDVVIADLPEEAMQPFDSAPLEAIYGYDHAAVIPTKVTATQLKGRMVDEELTDSALPTRMRASAFNQPRFMQPQVGLSATERGSAVHTVMEHIDFATPATLEAVEEAIAAMQSRKMLTDLQAEAVDRELVVRFLASPLAQRIRAAEKVYREYRFALLVDAAMYDPSAAGEEMILQGVADCVLV